MRRHCSGVRGAATPRAATARRARVGAVLAGVLVAGSACAPRVAPLGGIPVEHAAVPVPAWYTEPQLMRLRWQYRDDTFGAQGEGVVRLLPPNRARLDLFIANGYGGGMALLDGDALFVPGIDVIGRFLPPPPLLWGALGRLALPTTTDTLLRLDGDTVRADLTESAPRTGQVPRVWRAHFAGRTMARLERIEQRRVVEWMSRVRDTAGAVQVEYVHATGRRRLSLTVDEILTIPDGFDAAIWRKP